MAVDTAAKRMSLVGYGMPFRLALPAPDGTIGQGDRQHLAGLYSGILASAGVVAVPIFRPAITYDPARRPITYNPDRDAIVYEV